MSRPNLLRRRLLGAVIAALAIPAAAAPRSQLAVEVYKSATCGCCGKWIEHLQANGFAVRAHDVAEPATYRAKLGVPDALGSCHTATIGGYVLEGHVPAQEVKRLLAERPRARGLAVPAMPAGSPGMEGPRADAYEVLLIETDGRARVYARYVGATRKG